MSMHKFDPKHHARLDDPARRKILNPEEILRKAELRPGLVVCDIGCGTGFFTLAAARMAGEKGLVYGVDSSAEMLELLRKRLAGDGQTAGDGTMAGGGQTAGGERADGGRPDNIQLVLSQELAIPLPDRTADFAFMSNVLHEITQRSSFLQEVHRLVRPGGTVTVVDWVAAPTEAGPPVEDRLPKEQASELLKQAGFRVVKEFEAGPFHYGVTALKPA
ncbi:MAG: methyltransferase domain-containing protein [Firmicutes bacterium]|nr:methyltransferase domain-containing protein [Bacillota bacterium]